MAKKKNHRKYRPKMQRPSNSRKPDCAADEANKPVSTTRGGCKLHQRENRAEEGA